MPNWRNNDSTEGSGFVRHDGHDLPADLRILEKLGQHLYKDHGGRNVAFHALEKAAPGISLRGLHGLGAYSANRHRAAQRAAALPQILDLLAVLRRHIERRLVQV